MRRVIIAASVTVITLIAIAAEAETLHRGRVVQTTADRIIADRQLACRYTGKVDTVTLPNGSTAVILAKVCQEEKR